MSPMPYDVILVPPLFTGCTSLSKTPIRNTLLDKSVLVVPILVELLAKSVLTVPILVELLAKSDSTVVIRPTLLIKSDLSATPVSWEPFPKIIRCLDVTVLRLL
jgi:hypothetical protein